MPTVSCRPSRLFRFDELTVEVDSALRTRANALAGALTRYGFACDAAFVADVFDSHEAVRAWSDGHRRLGDWTYEVGAAFFNANVGADCFNVRPRPGGVTTVDGADVSASASPGVDDDVDPDLIGPRQAVLRPPILEALPLAPGGAATPLWQQVVDGGIVLSGPVGAAAAVAALEPRGAHAVIPTRRIAFGRWIGHAATGFSIADGVQSGLDATRGRPLNDRVEAATVGAGVASAFGAAGAATATSTAPYPLVAATVIVLALAGGEVAGRAVDQFAAVGRRESPAGDDLDALREEIADDDPGDVLVAATELAAAEQATAASVGDPALNAQVQALTGPIPVLEADLAEAVDDGSDG